MYHLYIYSIIYLGKQFEKFVNSYGNKQFVNRYSTRPGKRRYSKKELEKDSVCHRIS